VDVPLSVADWSPDGRFLILMQQDQATGIPKVVSLDLQGGNEIRPLIETPDWNFPGKLSPDGRHIAYISSESGRMQVFIKRFPSGEGKWQVSVDGGYWPRWNERGDEIFFVTRGNEMMVVDVETEPTLRLGTPQVLFTMPSSGVTLPFNWPDGFDATPDGQRFVMLQSPDEAEDEIEVEGITVVQNWFAEFREE
jgi:Tol biopolymer transport system component